MGTIAEKLSYLANTKDLFKDRLNSLGAEITSATTFRNYLNWLDTFYGEVSDKTDLSQNGVVGRTSQNTAILPSEYTQVDYIESHGEEWIDTNVFPYRTTVEYTFAYNNFTTGTYRRFVAAYDKTSSPTLRYYSCQGNGNNPDKLTCTNYVNTIYELGNTDTNKHTIIFNDSNGNVYFDGVLKATSENFNLPRQSANNLSIFATGGSINISKIAGKLWNLKIYDKENNNELVRDFIPCYRNSDNEVGLYDLVNNVFYTNQGTGAFTYGAVVDIPNPDYPQSINNLSGNVPYKVSGKNLAIFEQPDTTISGLTIIYDNATGKISIKGKATTTTGVRVSKQMQTNIPSGTYTLSINSALPVLINYVVTDSQNNNTAFRMTAGNTSVTNTLSNNGVQASLFVAIENNVQYDLEFYMQLESGSTPTTYEPYISQTFNIPLGDIELCNIDTYEDKIYSNDGRFYLNKNCGSSIFDNNNTQVNAVNNTSSSPSGISLNGTYAIIKNILNTNITNNTLYCSIAKYEYNSTITDNITAQTNLNNNAMCMRQGLNDRIYFKNSVFTGKTGTEIKELIEGEKLYYGLETPTTTEITQENYPSLYNALKQIQDYLTAYKINKEFILGYSSPEIEY